LNDLAADDDTVDAEMIEKAVAIVRAHIANQNDSVRNAVENELRSLSSRNAAALIKALKPVYDLSFAGARQISRHDVNPRVLMLMERLRAFDDEQNAENAKKYRGLLVPQTIDSVQGQEADVVIVSFVRSNERKAIGFLGMAAGLKRVNVALSRAKDKIVLIGSFKTLVEGSRQRSGRSVFEDLEDEVTEIYRRYNIQLQRLDPLEILHRETPAVRATLRLAWDILARFPTKLLMVFAAAVGVGLPKAEALNVDQIDGPTLVNIAATMEPVTASGALDARRKGLLRTRRQA
jgi:hypothetical protein